MKINNFLSLILNYFFSPVDQLVKKGQQLLIIYDYKNIEINNNNNKIIFIFLKNEK